MLTPAPAVQEADYNELKLGMTYPQVMRVLLGYGNFKAEVVDVDKKRYGYDTMVRAIVTYESMDSEEALYVMVFEGNLMAEPYQIKLVEKHKSNR